MVDTCIYRRICIFALSFFTCTLILSQESQQEFPKTLYTLSQYGPVSRYDETENSFLITEERELIDENDRIRVDTIFIKKRIDNADYIVARPRRKELAVMRRTEAVQDSIYLMGPILEGLTEEEVLEKYQNQEIPLYAALFSRVLFTKAKLAVVQNAPGLDEITRKDLIASLQWRESIGEALKSYAEDNPDMQPHRLYRMVQNYRDQKLFLLGYNPYKQVAYNLEKQFEGDDEVLKLLTEPVSFD